MQATFVAAYLRTSPTLSEDARGKQAAIEAGYSPRTARSAGAKLLAKPHIKELILAAQPRALAERAGIDAVWLLNELAELWEAPLDDLFEDDGSIRDILAMGRQTQKLIAGFEVEQQTDEDGHTSTRISRVRLIDRVAVLDKIGKHHMVGAYTAPEERAAQQSLARLVRALEMKVLGPGELDVTPTQSAERRFSDVLESQEQRSVSTERRHGSTSR